MSSAAVGVMGSPEAAFAADEGLISVHFPTNEGDVPGSHYSCMYFFPTTV